MKKLASGLLFALLLLPCESLAQFGAYTTHGFGASGSLRSVDNATVIGGRAGYVLPAPFEVGARVFRRKVVGSDFTSTGVGPYLAFYPVRENQGYPFSIVMDGDYSYVRYSGSRTDEREQDGSGTGSAFTFGTGFFPTLEVTDSFHLVPYLGIRYTIRSRARSSGEARETTSIDARLPLQFKLTSAASVAVVPSVSLGDNDTNRFGLSAVLVFGE